MQINRLPSVSLEESVKQATLVEKRVLEAFPDEVATVVSKTGRAEIATDAEGVNTSDVLGEGLEGRSRGGSARPGVPISSRRSPTSSPGSRAWPSDSANPSRCA